MKQLEHSIQMDCILTFNVYIGKKVKRKDIPYDEYEYYDKEVRMIEDLIYSTQTSIVPENNDVLNILLPDKYKNVDLSGSYNMGNKHIIRMSDIFLDFTTDNHRLVLNKDIYIRLIEEEIEKAASANNELAWEVIFGKKDIARLSIDDIIKLYHQTLHKGVMII